MKIFSSWSGTCRAGFAIVLAAAVLTAAAEQDPEAPREAPAFTEVVDVELVNVEAWVNDRKGRSVTGLAVDDFEVFEDGEQVAITHFAEVASPGAWCSCGRRPHP